MGPLQATSWLYPVATTSFLSGSRTCSATGSRLVRFQKRAIRKADEVMPTHAMRRFESDLRVLSTVQKHATAAHWKSLSSAARVAAVCTQSFETSRSLRIRLLLNRLLRNSIYTLSSSFERVGQSTVMGWLHITH